MSDYKSEGFNTAKFETTTDIPDWFNLNKYVNSGNLTNKQWRQQLECRFCLLHNLAAVAPDQAEIFEPLNETRLFGIPDSVYKDYDYTDTINKEVSTYSEIKHYAIRPLRMIEIACDGEGLLGPLMKGELQIPDAYSEDSLSMPFDIYRKGTEDDSSKITLAYLAVDLRLPISDLIHEFKNFVPEYRRKLGIEHNPLIPSDSTIGKLTNYKILAFLDLYIWELENKKRIKRSRYAGALFPDNMYGEIDLDQIIKPFAFKVLDLSFLSRLYKY
jgi:hypothetical protein